MIRFEWKTAPNTQSGPVDAEKVGVISQVVNDSGMRQSIRILKFEKC
ncbi:hypothetical protein SBDP1_720001 [Syntrophobacter sp. SbD1]|nr:hypothetical protein SBDP1_720001 [Syntrophobacter sp. SbD1]